MQALGCLELELQVSYFTWLYLAAMHRLTSPAELSVALYLQFLFHLTHNQMYRGLRVLQQHTQQYCIVKG